MAASLDLERLFQTVGESLGQNRERLNLADAKNGNHGDHMLEIFQIAAQAARERSGDLAGAMDYAGRLLRRYPENGSAQVYARGLEQFALEFRNRNITLDELAPYVQGILADKQEQSRLEPATRSGEVLKALLAGLAGWQQAETGQAQAGKGLDMGYLFDLGVSYMQAKQRGGSKAEVIADAAASASPLSSVPHRYLSGKMAIQALLEAMAAAAGAG
jgi:hypothetical protein